MESDNLFPFFTPKLNKVQIFNHQSGNPVRILDTEKSRNIYNKPITKNMSEATTANASRFNFPVIWGMINACTYTRAQKNENVYTSNSSVHCVHASNGVRVQLSSPMPALGHW